MIESLRAPWQQAGALAAQAPPERNRYVDFLRAASILVVVFGHWLVAAPFIQHGEIVPKHMLAYAPWTQWLTLLVQVMPIFFLVGGYANGLAWAAAQRNGTPYASWLSSRLQRLLRPVLPVLLAWIGLVSVALLLGAPPAFLTLISQAALVPTWFLAVYVMIGVLVPLSWRAWQRYGFRSLAFLTAGAVLTDALVLTSGIGGIGYINYAFVWLGVHQLGYAWQQGRLQRPLVWSAIAGLATAALIKFGPYPVSMVGVPGLDFDNTGPPTLALLTFGIAQSGIVISLEASGRRILANAHAWTATVLINGSIMTLYLWHMTAMLLVLGAALALGGIGLQAIPDSGAWWLARPVWMLAYAVCLLPFVALLGRFERPQPGAPPLVSRRRLVAGASLSCYGLYSLSRGGLVTGTGLRVLPLLLPLIGTSMAAVGPFPRLLKSSVQLEGSGS